MAATLTQLLIYLLIIFSMNQLIRCMKYQNNGDSHKFASLTFLILSDQQSKIQKYYLIMWLWKIGMDIFSLFHSFYWQNNSFSPHKNNTQIKQWYELYFCNLHFMYLGKFHQEKASLLEEIPHSHYYMIHICSSEENKSSLITYRCHRFKSLCFKLYILIKLIYIWPDQ